jgi:hypothetical protein
VHTECNDVADRTEHAEVEATMADIFTAAEEERDGDRAGVAEG